MNHRKRQASKSAPAREGKREHQVQYAKAAGFATIAISHSADKDKLVRELGADEIVRDGKGLASIALPWAFYLRLTHS